MALRLCLRLPGDFVPVFASIEQPTGGVKDARKQGSEETGGTALEMSRIKLLDAGKATTSKGRHFFAH